MTAKLKTIEFTDISKFVRENLNRLLLLAVILSGCFALRFAAYGKYVDMINDYTSARAGNFFFTSNYLGRPEDNTEYSISSFDGSSYKLDLEIRNYDNAFNYNKEGVDYYYYLTAEVFEDKNLTVPAKGFSTTIQYDIQGKGDAAMVRLVKSSKTDSGIANPIIDNTTSQYNKETEYKHLGKLCGYDSDGSVDESGNERGTAAVRENGKQVCTVNLSWTNQVRDKVYLKLSAHTVPPTKTSDVPTEDQLTIEKVDRDNAPELIPDYENMMGVFESEMNALFILNPNGSSIGDIKAERIVSSTDYEVLFRLSCSFDVSTRVYFNPEKLVPDVSLEPVMEDPEKEGYEYFDVRIPANGMKSCYLYRRSLSTHISSEAVDDDLFFIQIKEEEELPTSGHQNEPAPEEREEEYKPEPEPIEE